MEKKHRIAARVAKELNDGDVVNLGIGLPTMVSHHLPEGVTVITHGENGIIGVGPEPDVVDLEATYVVNAGGYPATVAPGGSYIDSAVSFGLIRGGHVDCTVLGALEVDAEGNLANWIIPGSKLSGMGGAMDLVVGAKKVIVAMEHTAKGNHKILKRCRLPLTAVQCVDMIVTEMGVIQVVDEGLMLMEYNPEYTLEQILEATEAPLLISEDLKPMA